MSWLFGFAAIFGISAGQGRIFETFTDSPIAEVVGMIASIVFFLLAVWANAKTQVLRGKRVRGDFIWLRGAGEEFLTELPHFDGR